ncbi:ABC transporter ATP-binding protein [Kocuria rhizophila]|uniref:ABC transporter ATP-binding protein n=1 Tax=Kocuria rhizophila TaxID=72000 RepID=UPI000C87BC80|nr:ABC transporter ATP-binding protein [Kocuria rhizophila]MCT1957826.1 ABC transporter ATP-binding protein [Kocuria rhizophila]MCT2074117.1 ABC transporter ATP-binding protein [Kocuria rhizophila]PMR91662.1 ABC transporter ATP-binding protein [Kocuria rhizophila]
MSTSATQTTPGRTDADLAIRVRHMTKEFVLRHTRSMKEAFVWLVKGRKGDLTAKFTALNDVSFDIHDGETVALLGFNGSGKSTTLKMISGVMNPDSGEILTREKVAGLIEVGAGFHPDLTGRDNVYLNGAILGMSKEEIDAKFDDIVEFSEIAEFIDTEVKFYSSGMYLRLAFSVAVHTDPEVFLVDEILSVGDEPFQKKCIGRIKDLVRRGKTLVVVSHDLNLVMDICERGIVMDHGTKVFDGNVYGAVAHMRNQPEEDVRREHAEGLARALEDKRRKREWQAQEAAERGEEFVPQYDPDLDGPLAG